jgi:beta-galactosidase
MQKTSIDPAWRFYLEGKAGEEPDEAASSWINLPHDWSIEQPRQPDAPSGFSGGYFPMGRGHYTKTLDVPEEWRGKVVLIEFEGVYMNAEVRLNEHFITRHPY